MAGIAYTTGRLKQKRRKVLALEKTNWKRIVHIRLDDTRSLACQRGPSPIAG